MKEWEKILATPALFSFYYETQTLSQKLFLELKTLYNKSVNSTGRYNNSKYIRALMLSA